jgi:PAS domain S-box-containing protein
MVFESSRELAWIRERLEPPLEEAPEAAIIATNLEGRVAFWNAQAERLYGWREEEALGNDILELTPATYTRDQANEIMQALKAGRRWEGEIILRRRDGTELPAFVLDIPIGDFEQGQGAIVGLSFRADRQDDAKASSAEAYAAIQRRFHSV